MRRHEISNAKEELSKILESWLAQSIHNVVVSSAEYIAGNNIRLPASGVRIAEEDGKATLNPDIWHPHHTASEFHVHYGFGGYHFSSEKEESKLIRTTLRNLLGRPYVHKEKTGFIMRIPFDEPALNAIKEHIQGNPEFPERNRSTALIDSLIKQGPKRPAGRH